MIIPLGINILITSYFGSKILEKYFFKRRKRRVQNQALLENTDHSPTEMVLNDRKTSTDFYFKLSSVAIGISTARLVFPALTILNVLIISFATVPIFKDVEKSLFKERRIKNDLLNSIASVGCIATGQFFAAGLLAWFYHLGTKMVDKIQMDAKKRLTNVFELQQSTAYVLKDGAEIEVAIEKIHVDNTVIVNTGGTVPVDGVIVKGIGAIDQHTLTGESMPAEKEIGDKVFASSLVVSGCLHVKVNKAGVDTTVSKINNILNKTSDFKTRLQSKGEAWANNAAVPLLGFGAFSFPLIGFSKVMMLLYSSPGNNIRVMNSLQTLNHLALISHKGILVKDGRALEKLAEVDTILFDKTGTLTTETPEVGEITACNQSTEQEVLLYAAAAEFRLTHPIALAILKKAEATGLKIPEINDSKYQIGYGIQVSLEGRVIKVGSPRFMEMEKIPMPDSIQLAIQHSRKQGHTLVIVAVNDCVQGAIKIVPQIRPEVKNLVKDLHDRGVKHCAIVSGDHEQPTKILAESIGMDEYYCDVLPQQKSDIVKRLQKEGKTVCFVGDGINDAIAMKTADVSISLSGATSVATDIAQIIFMEGGLSRIDDLFDISNALNKKLKQSSLICVAGSSINIIAIFSRFLGVLPSIILLSAIVPGIGVSHAMMPLRQIRQENKAANATPKLLTG